MNNASLELGGTNWAEKDASLLGYTVSDDSKRFFPQEFTFSRGSNLAATRIGKTGLIEKGRENLLVQSNQFDTTWTVAGSTITDGQSGYDGSNDAWLLSKSSASGNLGQNTTSNGVTTFSVYAKANASLYLRLIIFDGTFAANGAAYFDLQNGALGTTNAIDSNIESVGNGWYRCSVSFNTSNQRVYIYPAEANSTTGTTGSIYIQDAQLELGLSASPYIPTTTTTAQAGVLENTPRLNYTAGVANPYLLLEPSRTNLFPYSEYFNTDYSSAGALFIENATTSPEGVVNATTFEGSGTLTYIRLAYSIIFSSAGDHTLSLFAKAGTNDFFACYFEGFTGASGVSLAYFDLSDGTTPTSGVSIEAVGTDGWYRCSITTNIDSGDLAGNLVVLCAPSTSSVFYPTAGDADGKNIQIYGAQLEQGSYPTSYIPTYGASTTRGFDYSIIESLGYSSTCTFYYEFNTTTGREKSAPFVEVGKDNSNKFYIKGSSANNPQFQVQGNGIFNGSIAPTNEVSGINKIAVQWSNGVGVVFSNGVKQSGTLTNSDTSQNIDFISAKGEGTPHDSKQLLFFEEALSDAELITLTTI